jgi:lysophospholipase L1-like esterase
MNFVQLLKEKQDNINGANPVTIAFLGDSVTQGCFECYLTGPSTLQTVFDYSSSYSTRLKEILNILYPAVQINIINSGISGDSAAGGLARLERDVLKYKPDLTVVSFGLNDSTLGKKKVEEYINSLKTIFERLKQSGSEVVFLTQNYMNDITSPHLTDELFINLSKVFADIQKNGTLQLYFDRAKELCASLNIKVCDLYSVWQTLNNSGVNTSELLANKLNHPIRQFHNYMAIKLVEIIFDIK